MKGFNVDGQLRKLPSGYLFIMIFFLLPSLACCQSYSIRHFGIQDGLPASQVMSLLKDELGYLWIGTHGGGLVRYDGAEFVTYTTRDGLVNNYVTQLARDFEGNIWIGTQRGLSKFNGVSFNTIQFEIDSGTTQKHRRIKQLLEHNGAIYFVNFGGRIGKVNEKKGEWLDNTESALFLAPDANGELYYQSFGNKLINLLNQEKRIPLPPNLIMKEVTHVSGRKMINSNKGLFRIEDNSLVAEFADYDSGPLLINSNEGIAWDLSNQLLQLKLSQPLTINQHYPEVHQITVGLQDENDEVWLGTFALGLVNIRKRVMEKVFSATGYDIVMAIGKAGDQSYWFGSYGGGLFRYNSQTQQSERIFFEGDDFRKNIVTSLKSVRGETWIGTYGGLGLYRDDKFTWVLGQRGNPIDSITSIDVDANNTLWVGRRDKGFEKVTNGGVEHIPFQEQTILSVKYIEADSTLYVGTYNGVYTYKEGVVEQLNIPTFDNGVVYSLDVFRHDYLLVASESDGVLFYNVKDGSHFSVSVEDGILSTLLYFIKAEGDYVWIGTVKGINRIRLDGKNKVVEVLSLNHLNGFDGIEANGNSFFLSEEIKLFGSSDGVYKYNNTESPKAKTGKLHFQGVDLFYGARAANAFSDSTSGFFKIPHEPTFNAANNHLTFRFNAANTSVPGGVLYTYRLAGLDPHWSKESDIKEGTYSSLPPGSYVFSVRLIDAKSKDVLEEISYPFSISPPLYRQTWFLVVTSFGILVSLVVIFRAQVRKHVERIMELTKVREEENHRLRTEIARDFHDEMGNHLVTISNNVNLLLVESKNSRNTEILRRIDMSVRYINTQTRDFVWSINPSHNNLDDLFLYLRDFAEGFFRNTGIVFQAESTVSQPHPITYRFSKEAILIFKEAFTNARRHSKAKKISFSLAAYDLHFIMKVWDDGVGMRVIHTTRGGLSNMLFRAKKIGANFYVSSEQHSGTTIELKFTLGDKTHQL
ncbi:MAG: two-component regulator propeller domain-containing protein [Cyclobacteriaceae bacterium]